jgi:hypothetical protein
MDVERAPAAARTREFALTWAIIAVLLGGGLIAEKALRNGADGAAPIRERTGFVYDVAQSVPSISGLVSAKRTAVLFARPAQAQAVCQWAAGIPLPDVTMVLVAQKQVPCPPGVTENVDPDGKLAQGFHFRPTKDGGYPVGYALLDSNGGFVYNTLDRGYYKRNWWDRHLYRGKRWEMQTVMKQVP